MHHLKASVGLCPHTVCGAPGGNPSMYHLEEAPSTHHLGVAPSMHHLGGAPLYTPPGGRSLCTTYRTPARLSPRAWVALSMHHLGGSLSTHHLGGTWVVLFMYPFCGGSSCPRTTWVGGAFSMYHRGRGCLHAPPAGHLGASPHIPPTGHLRAVSTHHVGDPLHAPPRGLFPHTTCGAPGGLSLCTTWGGRLHIPPGRVLSMQHLGGGALSMHHWGGGDVSSHHLRGT